MISLNETLIRASYDWLVVNSADVHIWIFGDGVIKNPHLISKIRKNNNIDMLILNITPRAAPVTFLENGLFVKCRVNGVPVEEIIPYECVWFIGSMHNPSLRVNLPQEKVIGISDEPVAPKPKPVAKPKFGVIDGGKS